MAKTPSLDAKIEKARADALAAQELSAQLAASLSVAPDEASETVLDDAAREIERLRDREQSLEADLLSVVEHIGASTQAAYAAFDKVDERSHGSRFFSFFTRRKPPSYKVVRLKKLSVAEMARDTLLQAAVVHDLFVNRKAAAASLVVIVEPNLVASMEKRRLVVSAMDEARQRDKVLAASLATLNRKILDASDEMRLESLKAEEAEITAQHKAVLEERDVLRKQHNVLDRQAILFGDLIDLQNEAIALHTLLLNKVSVEAERCIQLYDAAYGALDPLLAEAKPSFSADDSTPKPLDVFKDVLTLHSQGAVSMQDIERRKARIDEALSGRSSAASGAKVSTSTA
ncbi:hypothetical protein G6L37_18380 [Agrobacterium rubi]|uniref:hypothetical protein n=1 Tax=Agrobacterium rubi TaxID=28099 RepID=UPI001574DAC3|nr:hypothetical protein [Agrobacterium rubi]NTF08138.1 hypothetical protein [Agrobacterium rubi]NTF20366.1 hypothetical protein [Agrobacterium rubi]NTF27337.1 hypothetical protein [Agrobacterium rubi]